VSRHQGRTAVLTGAALGLGASTQLSGIFLVLVLRPDVAFVDTNPLLLSVEGEYVVKNLVFLAATAALALHARSPDRMRPPTTSSPTPTTQPTAPRPSTRHDRRTCERPPTRWRSPIRACLQRSFP
jgi:hypothetical protein